MKTLPCSRVRALPYFVETDDREVTVCFRGQADGKTEITQEFEPESTNSVALQRADWQAILDNFKRYAEGEEKSKELLVLKEAYFDRNRIL